MYSEIQKSPKNSHPFTVDNDKLLLYLLVPISACMLTVVGKKMAPVVLAVLQQIAVQMSAANILKYLVFWSKIRRMGLMEMLSRRRLRLFHLLGLKHFIHCFLNNNTLFLFYVHSIPFVLAFQHFHL